MATKKEKRARGLAKREQFLAEVKRTGLEALKKDRERRAHELRKAWQKNHDKNHSWKKRIKECPLCQDIQRGAPKIVPIDTDEALSAAIDEMEFRDSELLADA